jgi:hypothetical protein
MVTREEKRGIEKECTLTLSTSFRKAPYTRVYIMQGRPTHQLRSFRPITRSD